MGERYNIHSQLEHLQSKYIGTGHADTTKWEWLTNQHRDRYRCGRVRTPQTKTTPGENAPKRCQSKTPLKQITRKVVPKSSGTQLKLYRGQVVPALGYTS